MGRQILVIRAQEVAMSQSDAQQKADAGSEQRAVQQEQDRRDAQQPQGEEHKEPVQAGHQDYPAPPLPGQHPEKPGLEHEMELKPQFMAPHYCGSGKLAGMAAVITGGDSGIGRAVAVLYAREG